MMSLSSAPTSQCLEATGSAEGGLSDRVDLLSRTRGSTVDEVPPVRSTTVVTQPAAPVVQMLLLVSPEKPQLAPNVGLLATSLAVLRADRDMMHTR
jgi:hypothetical protein